MKKIQLLLSCFFVLSLFSFSSCAGAKDAFANNKERGKKCHAFTFAAQYGSDTYGTKKNKNYLRYNAKTFKIIKYNQRQSAK
jgi:hypothetical protein